VTPPTPLAKQPATVGLTNTVYWVPAPSSWDAASSYPRAGGYAYRLNITNLTTCMVKSFNVPGGITASSFTVSGSNFPAAADVIDGTSFSYRLSTVFTYCQTEVLLHACQDTQTIYSDQSAAVVSLQDSTAPVLQSFTLDNGQRYTNQLTVPVELEANDPLPAGVPPGTVAPGLGYVEFSPTAGFECSLVGVAALKERRSSCTLAPYASDTTVTLTPGDGLHTVFARVFDQAQAPNWQPPGLVTPTPSAPPAGNVSSALSAKIVLDTTPPTLVVTRSPATVTVGQPVSFDGSESSDPPAGSGPGSGIDGGTAVWEFGDGTNASGLAATHTYTKAGSYTASFSMRDNAGNLSTTDIPLLIKAAPVTTTTTKTTTSTQTVTTTTASQPTTVTVTTGAKPPSTPPTARLTLFTVHQSHGRERLELRLTRAVTVAVEVTRLRPAPQTTIEKFSRRLHAGLNQLTLRRFPAQSRERVSVALSGPRAETTSTRTVTVTVG
jgi:PKD domain